MSDENWKIGDIFVTSSGLYRGTVIDPCPGLSTMECLDMFGGKFTFSKIMCYKVERGWKQQESFIIEMNLMIS